jgi:hypothetical protein
MLQQKPPRNDNNPDVITSLCISGVAISNLLVNAIAYPCVIRELLFLGDCFDLHVPQVMQ